MSQPNEFQTFIYLIGGIIFCLIGIFFSKNPDPLSRFYRRIDFIISICFIIGMLIIESYSQLYSPIVDIRMNDLLFIFFGTLLFLSSGLLNILYKNEINSDMNYKFGVSFFICGWIGVFYLIAELLR